MNVTKIEKYNHFGEIIQGKRFENAIFFQIKR